MLSQFKPEDESWKVSLDDFNMKLYSEIVTKKTAWYSFYFPVQLAMGLVSPFHWLSTFFADFHVIGVLTSRYFCTRFIRFATSFQAGIQDPVVQQQTKRILIETGKFFQAQDDYLDCFGDPKVKKTIYSCQNVEEWLRRMSVGDKYHFCFVGNG